VCLSRECQLQINKKKVYRLCKKLDILRPQRQKPVVYPRKLARNRTVTDSNQLFETDIKYGFIAGEERFFFIQSCIDVYDRSIVAFHIGLSCEAKDVASTLQSALMKRQLFEALEKPVIRSDNGPQFISQLARYEFQTYGEAYQAVTEYIRYYNERRIHSSIHDLSPYEFYDKNQKQLISIKAIRV
ncbi:DDE-type integrase/transposase/recombinase, partial [Paenibacillus larvae]|uniref:DDE-type integrase/transposase/recombinase n=1 Tax=Paenibacillus larvae TaxID=1464 RepID=UPI0030C9B2CB